MREIKFRGIRKDTNKWVHGFYSNIQNKEHYIMTPCALGNLHIEVLPETVGQFTGLKDKNGVNIYEWDIMNTDTGIAYVIWNDAAFALKSPGSNAVDWVYSTVYEASEVIGNIHDNPELIRTEE